MLQSYYKRLCEVRLPDANRQMYMHTFDLAKPQMAKGFEDYLEPVIALCTEAKAFYGLAHMTVDEKLIAAGMSQRRPKPHVDGCFMPSVSRWGHDDPGPQWLHTCNNIGLDAFKRMPVIVAASVPGCRVWEGEFDTQPANDGDLSNLELVTGKVLPANIGFLLSADCVHESMIQQVAVRRSFLRIALPTTFRF